MDVQTLEAVLQEVKRQQVALRHTDFSEDFAPGMAPLTKYAYFQRGMDLAFEGILKSLRDTIQHEADIGAEEITFQERLADAARGKRLPR